MVNFGFVSLPPDLSNPSPSPESWLAAKREADSQQGKTYDGKDGNVWRLHDELYDLSKFEKFHPGGESWIQITRGTDITEMFESHHPNIDKARVLLHKYRLPSSSMPPRNSGTFTFNPDGFYCTLRDRAWTEVLRYSGSGPTIEMLALHTALLISFLGLLFLAPVLEVFSPTTIVPHEWGIVHLSCLGTPWFVSAALSGFVLALLMMCSHNFFHQSDNWRMYMFDLSPFSSYDWRVTHAYSHHTFPNTSYDYEVSTTANLLNFYPYDFPTLKFLSSKSSKVVVLVKRVVQVIMLQFVFLIAMNLAFSRRSYLLITGGSSFRKENILPLVLYCVLFIIHTFSKVLLKRGESCESLSYYCSWDDGLKRVMSSESLLFPLYILLSCYAVSSWSFLSISLATGHHHPDCWHDGDYFPSDHTHDFDKLRKAGKPKSNAPSVDWGIFQIAAVGDRPVIDSSMVLASVSFGRHTLHHLFPTVDHSKLDLLLPLFEKTCRDFGVRFFIPKISLLNKSPSAKEEEKPSETVRNFTVYDAWTGMWKQLWRDEASKRNYVTWHKKE